MHTVQVFKGNDASQEQDRMSAAMRQLSQDQWHGARRFLLQKARPLEAARFRFHLQHGSAGEVLAALAAYQNPGGGFGRALEPDLRTPSSSALATSVALQILTEVGAPADHPFVQGAIAYLLTSYDSATHHWRIIPPEAEESPRAFWWDAEGLDERFNHFWLNPRAELLGALWRYASPKRIQWLEPITVAVVDEVVAHPEPLDGNELLCALRLAETEEVPQTLRSRLVERLSRDVAASVVSAPERWGEYVLRPLAVAPTPESPYASLLAESIQANLDYLLDTQGTDGAWSPVWSWAALDEAAWRKAEEEWKGILTLEALQALTTWGRIERSSTDS
jgi:hypothetical protein